MGWGGRGQGKEGRGVDVGEGSWEGWRLGWAGMGGARERGVGEAGGIVS